MPRKHSHLVALVLCAASWGSATPATSASLDAQAINHAQWSDQKAPQGGISPAMAKLQVLLDRAHFSPGEIDGKSGENLEKAIAAYADANGAPASRMSAELWQKLNESFDDAVIVEHKLTEADVKGPFAEKIPTRMEDMKDLPALSYTSPKEKVAELFHMSPELLSALNPGQAFDQAGDTIMVANVTSETPGKAARVEVDKTRQTLKLFGKDNTLLALYPITAGSREKPAPDGTLKVTSVAFNPTYRYNPDYAFKGVKAEEPFTIRPGPNNPVGVVWIGLSREGYGIHGTPDPSKVSKAESHGCIRLTNWDARQVASAVSKGLKVEFTGDERAARAAKAQGKRHMRSKR
jgi:lipoprotein-anchoring transpeptidase ErfK/SrfK